MDNQIHFVHVTGEYPYLKELLDIRDEAFPENERSSDRNLDAYINNTRFTTYAVEDNERLVGFTVLINIDEDYSYLLYLAIGQQFRSKHYGSIVLQNLINNELKGKALFGCIEALLPESENYTQRVKRAEFYTRNGMTVLDKVFCKEPVGSFQFFCSDSKVDFETLKQKMLMLAASSK